MKIKTKYFDEMEVTEEQKIYFPEPLPGFEGLSDYVIIQFYQDSDSLLCLQSLDDPELAFILLNPLYIVEKYAPVLIPEDLATLEANSDTPLAYYSIAVVHDNWQDSTTNLRCPIIVNPEKMLGKQIMLDDASLSMRHPIDYGLSKEA